MASLVVAGDVSGSVTLSAPSAAGSTVITLPTTSGTMVVTGGAQTIEFAAGSAASPSITFTGDTNTGIFSPAADTVAFSEGGVESMRIDSSGNVGIGVTPSNWSAYKALQVGQNTSLAGNTGGSVALLSTNAVFDGSSYKYITTDAATQYQQNTGAHIWRTATSGSAGATLTFTQVLSVEGSKSLSLQGATPQAGTGITFPATQSASSDANTLDDYEEGTFTPTLFGGSTAGTVTGGTITGRYTKIGQRIFIGIRVENVTVSGAAGGWIIGNLPFTIFNNADQQGFFIPMVYNVNFTTANVAGFYASNGSAQLVGFENVNGSPWASWAVTNASNIYFNLNVNYIVA